MPDIVVIVAIIFLFALAILALALGWRYRRIQRNGRSKVNSAQAIETFWEAPDAEKPPTRPRSRPVPIIISLVVSVIAWAVVLLLAIRLPTNPPPATAVTQTSTVISADATDQVTTGTPELVKLLSSDQAQRIAVEYDGNGNVVKRVNADGTAATYEYDAFDQLTAIHYPHGSNVTFEYDPQGNRTQMTDLPRSNPLFV